MVSGGVWQDLNHKLVCAASVDAGWGNNNVYYTGWTTRQLFPYCVIGRFATTSLSATNVMFLTLPYVLY